MKSLFYILLFIGLSTGFASGQFANAVHHYTREGKYYSLFLDGKGEFRRVYNKRIGLYEQGEYYTKGDSIRIWEIRSYRPDRYKSKKKKFRAGSFYHVDDSLVVPSFIYHENNPDLLSFGSIASSVYQFNDQNFFFNLKFLNKNDFELEIRNFKDSFLIKGSYKVQDKFIHFDAPSGHPIQLFNMLCTDLKLFYYGNALVGYRKRNGGNSHKKDYNYLIKVKVNN